MENPIIKINPTGEQVQIDLRTGDALPLKEPKIIDIKGAINSPLEWLQHKQIDLKKAHVLVNYDKRTITLIMDEQNHYAGTVKGELQLSDEFNKFGINSGEYKDPIRWSEFFKMNRALFANRSESLKLVSELANFTAKVNNDVEAKIDMNKGDRRVLLSKAVESNIPKSFVLRIPLFKGQDPIEIEVETYFNPDDLTATLVSPDAAEKVEDSKRGAIKEIVEDIKAGCPDLPIIIQ